MTDPKVTTERDRFDRRFYVDPSGELPKAISVTTIIGHADKPQLRSWSAKMAAEYAVDNLAVMRQLVEDGKRQDAVDLAKGAARRYTADAADRGTSAHQACEDILTALLRGIPLDLIEEQLPKTGIKAAFVRNFVAFLKEFDALPEFVEATVWNPEERYAGSFDSALRIVKFDGKLLLVDIKTSNSGIWPEVQLQLTAYAKAPLVVLKDGTRLPMPEVDGAAALWLRPEGFALHPIKITDLAWHAFLGLRDFAMWQQESYKVVEEPVNATPIRREKWGNGK